MRGTACLGCWAVACLGRRRCQGAAGCVEAAGIAWRASELTASLWGCCQERGGVALAPCPSGSLAAGAGPASVVQMRDNFLRLG